jgi:pSer/pThr/pTyr-binding forkhead associated (FHA) protein
MTTRPRAILKVLWGRAAGQKVVLVADESASVGRGEEARLSLPHDRNLSSIHFYVDFTGTMLRVRDAGSLGGTRVDGEPFVSGAVPSGSVITAGDTTFRIFLERKTPRGDVVDDPARLASAEAALAILRQEPSLHAVLDAARDPRVLTLLDESIEPAWSLYEGAEGDAMADVAPYLVRFAPDSDLLERVVLEGWGNAWGIYFVASRPLKEVRRHLRRFLMVMADETNERMYFRYYDPRVLREFMPVATLRQRSELLGDLTSILVEGSRAEIVKIDPLATEDDDAEAALDRTIDL